MLNGQRHEVNRASAVQLMPIDANLWRRMQWEKVSKVAVRSRRMRMVMSPESAARRSLVIISDVHWKCRTNKHCIMSKSFKQITVIFSIVILSLNISIILLSWRFKICFIQSIKFDLIFITKQSCFLFAARMLMWITKRDHISPILALFLKIQNLIWNSSPLIQSLDQRCYLRHNESIDHVHVHAHTHIWVIICL